MSQPSQLASYLKSSPVKIFAGSDRQLYYAHASVLSSASSQPLRQLVNGDWKESHEKSIEWTSVDSPTVARLLQFLYTGDYSAFDHEADDSNQDNGDESKTDQSSCQDPNDRSTEEPITKLISPFATLIPADTGSIRPLTPLETCLDAGLPEMSSHTEAGLVGSNKISGNLSPTIFAHAKLYTFAQYLDMLDLEKLALQRLTQTFILFDFTSPRMLRMVVDTISHIYNNTAERAEEEPARKLVTQFTAHNFHRLRTEELDALLSEGGDFVVDLCGKLSRKLLGGDQRDDELKELGSRIQKAEKVLTELEDSGNSRLRGAAEKVRSALFPTSQGRNEPDW